MSKILDLLSVVKDNIEYLIYSINVDFSIWAFLDILIVSLLFYWIYLFLKETRAMRILYGIIVLLLLFFASIVFNLNALNYLLRTLTTMFVVAIPVVFQPELRSALERIGMADIVSDFKKLNKNEVLQVIQEITNAVEKLSKDKVGALIVIGQKTGLRNIIDTGTKLSANISEELILSIFYPKNPLHDGAAVIRGNKISAAGCTLPLSDNLIDPSLGTRHKAAIGLSEQSDATIVVVSEERGTISLATRGILQKDITLDELSEQLLNYIQQGRLKQK